MSNLATTAPLAQSPDVSLSNPAQNQLLAYDDTTKKWTNATVSKSLVGLANVDNTSDTAKPVSTATQTALNAKLSLAQAMPTIFATSASSIPSRAASIPAGYTGKVIYDTADYPTHTGPTDMQVGDRWRRRVS